MSKTKTTIDRRSFLKVSSLASGGILIGFNFLSACKPGTKPPIDISKLNFNDFNAYIKIADNGIVTIFAPNPEIGQGVKTSMPMIVAEELDVAWKDVYVKQAGLNPESFRRQLAGGSQSIRFSWNTLRETGATARQMLVNAAATKWGVAASECTTKEGVIFHGSKKMGYGEIVKEAAALEVPKDVKLKDPKDFHIIGKEGVGVADINDIVTGKPLYGLDVKQEGMVYASVVFPPAFGKRLVSFDDTAAKALDGVIETLQVGPPNGQIPVVIAKTTWQAMQAKKALVVKWENASPLEDTAFHDKKLMELLDGNTSTTLRSDGNTKKAFATADQVIEDTYEFPFLPHSCMEPMNFFANVTDQKVELEGPIQTPSGTARRIARFLGRDPKNVHLKMTRAGGGFGRRLVGNYVLMAADISRSIKKPVQLVHTREDDILNGYYRPGCKYRIKAAIKDKKVVGIHFKEAAMDASMYNPAQHFFPAGLVPNYTLDSATFATNVTQAPWRAPFTNTLACVVGSIIKDLSDTLGVDNIQLQLDLLQHAKENNYKDIDYSPERMIEVVKTIREKSNWGEAGKGVYQGFAAYYCHNTHVAEVADVVMEDGKPVIKKVTCVVDCGIVVNPSGARNQIEGAVLDGIGHAMYGKFDFKDGAAIPTNFHNYRLIRMEDTPIVETHFIENEIAPTGLGEPALPPASAAIANAIKAATGVRMTKQPFIENKEVFG